MADLQSAFEHLSTTLERIHSALNFPGLTIGITNRERLLFMGVYGHRSRETQLPVTADTLFQIGSISKAFTSIALLQLQEQGLLDINHPITKYLPWFQVQSQYEPITLRALMSHTAGIISGSDATPSAFTETWDLRRTRATAPPGEMFHYSNSGYKALGLALQAIVGERLEDILNQWIFEPLGMSVTEPVITNAIRSRLAVGYSAFHDDRPLPRAGELAPATWFESDTADGSISSNAEDMCGYLRALLNQGDTLLAPESFEQLTHPMVPTGDDLHGEYYGLGLSTRQVDGHRVIGHSGGMVGYTADLLADLNAGLGVVVLTNGPGDPEELSAYILKLLRRAQEGDKALPDFIMVPPVERPEDYAGGYHCGQEKFTLTPEDGQLYLEFHGDRVHLEAFRPEMFLVPHPDFEMFPLCFQPGASPDGEHQGPITEAFHGPDWYTHDRYQGATSYVIPPEWGAYTGHYRSHNPWLTNFRIVIQKDSLALIHQWDKGEPLHQTDAGSFRVGEDSRSPEFIQFDTLIDGKAMSANLSGGAYSRTFTP